jgi:hypothetical protein
VEQVDGDLVTEPNSAVPVVQEGQDDETSDIVAKIKAYLSEQGISPEILQNLDAFLAEPENPQPDVGDPEPPPNHGDNALAGQTAVGGLDEDDDDDEANDEITPNKQPGQDEITPEQQEGQVVTKTAMDAAIKAAVGKAQQQAIRTQREIRNAERAVRPWVGDLAMDASHPSQIYRTALKALGMDASRVDAMHADALVPVLEAQPKPSRRVPQQQKLAADSQPQSSFAERFPEAGKVVIQ